MNKCRLILVVFILLLSAVTGLNFNSTLSKLRDPTYLIIGIADFIYSISNISLFKTDEYFKCKNLILSEASSSTDSFQDTMNYCGKDLGDQGQEMECIKNDKTTFFLLRYKLDYSSLKNKENTDFKVMLFLKASDIYTGFCMYKDCMSFLVQHYFNEKENKIFIDFLEEGANITNVSFILTDEYKNLTPDFIDKEDPNRKILDKVLLAITIFTAVLFGIMVTVSVINLLYSVFSDENKEYDEQNDESSSHDPNKTMSNDSQIASGIPYESTQRKLIRKVFKVLSNLDFLKKLHYFIGLKNRYYNDQGLEVISFIRSIVMFFVIYYYICYSLLVIPPQDPYNITFYKSSMFFLVKLSTFSIVCWIILDGILLSYKLMSEIKEYMMTINRDVPFTIFAKFGVYSISKVILVVIIFVYLNVLGTSFAKQFKMGIMFEYFIDNVISKETLDIQNMTFSQSFPKFLSQTEEITFSYFNIYLNEFCCMIIVLLLIYISFKLRSKLYDLIILLIIPINCCLAILEAYDVNELNYNINQNTDEDKIYNSFAFVLGENNSYRLIYLFINFYFMGVFVGLCYFYYNDMLSGSPLCQIEDEPPFYYCFWIVKKCDRLKLVLKYLFLIIFFSLMTLISFSFKISLRIAPGNDTHRGNNDKIKGEIYYVLNAFHCLIFIYEKGLFGFLFCGVLLFLMVHPKDTSLKHIIHSNIFLPFSRITVAFFCVCKSVIFTSITSYNFKIYMSYHDFFFASVALFVLSCLISVFITILYEMPLKFLIQKIMRKFKTKTDNDYNGGSQPLIKKKKKFSLFKE